MVYLKLKELNCTCEEIDLDKYITFRELVKENMEYPEWLGDFSREDLEFLLKNNSKIWLYYLNEDFVCSMMLIPADEGFLSKFGITLDYKEVADYGPIFVSPQYVGQGLQYQMLQELDNYCSIVGYKYAISTVHPDNIYSINNFVRDSFEYRSTKEFKRGTRSIYLKKL